MKKKITIKYDSEKEVRVKLEPKGQNMAIQYFQFDVDEPSLVKCANCGVVS